MARVFLVVMDSVGCGGAPDAEAYFNGDVPDTGSNTLGHIIADCAAGKAEDGRTGPLHIPNMEAMGLASAVRLASNDPTPGMTAPVTGTWGAATEISRGKDTPSGHWELAGLPVPWDWTYFPNTDPAFPQDVMQAVCKAAGTEGTLGNAHASGTEVMDLLCSLQADRGLTLIVVTHDPAIATSVGRAVAIKDGKTSTETTREVSFERKLGGEATGTEEFLLIDSAGSVQIPRDMLDELNIGRRVRVDMKDGRVTLESGD